MNVNNPVFLMYCGRDAGGQDYRKWSPEEAETVIVYKTANSTEAFFPGVLLLAIRSGSGGALVPGFGTPGNQQDWLTWLEDIFLPGSNLDAICETVRRYNLPPVDIWVSLPYPDTGQKKFGRVLGKILNFSSNADRVSALKWWIRRFLNRWEPLDNDKKGSVNLKGFYWARESMTIMDRLMLPGLLKHIKHRGFKTLWIPYYAVTQFLNIQDPGFDIIVIQPSYLQNPDVGWQRLRAAYKRAVKYGTGIEIEFDTSALYTNTDGFKIALDYINRGLPEYEGYMNEMFIACYSGYKTIVGLHKNKSPLYEYLFRFVRGTLTKINYHEINY